MSDNIETESRENQGVQPPAVRRGPKLKGPVTDDDFKTFENLCKIQCTVHEIAAFYDVDTNTIEARVRERYGRKFSDVFRDKRKLGHVSLRRKQYEKALDGNTTMLIWLGKQYLAQLDKVEGVSMDFIDRNKERLSNEELDRRIQERLERRIARDNRQGATARGP
jgi:hypothetical protein